MSQDNSEFIESLQEIKIVKPTELIIQQIKQQISSGKLKAGDRLPPERTISKRLQVGRGYVREAIKKLEFYGVLKTIPHRGTVVASLGVKALEGLITNMLELEKDDYKSLIETRQILETNAIRLTTQRASDDEIEKIEQAHQEYCKLANNGNPSIEVDFLFHLRIAEFCQNPVLRSIISLITPDVISHSENIVKNNEGYVLLSKLVMQEHADIVSGIRSRNPEQAAQAMSNHLHRILTLVTDYETGKDNFDVINWISEFNRKKLAS